MSDVASEIHKIVYYRTINGKRVPYCLTLDANRNFVHDGEVAEVKGKQPSHFVEKLKQEPENVPREHAAQIEHLRRIGADFTVSPDGGIVIHSIGDEMKHQLRLFNKHVPCWFEGCAELRQAYFKEVEVLNSEPDCNVNCARARLMRKYLEMAKTYPGFSV